MQGVHCIPYGTGTVPLPHSSATWASSSSSTKIKIADVLQLANNADPSKDFVLLYGLISLDMFFFVAHIEFTARRRTLSTA